MNKLIKIIIIAGLIAWALYSLPAALTWSVQTEDKLWPPLYQQNALK